VVKGPKTAAGIRNVTIPPPLMPILREHLLQHAQPGRDGLLFPGVTGGHLQPSTFYGSPATFDRKGTIKRNGSGWYRARQAAGREDLPFHGLRHTGAVLYAQQGATLAELMDRLGHTTAAAAMRYQHAAEDRAHELARRLGEQMTGAVDA
jgi:integrase